jgi:hypothetical protein
MFKSLVMTIAAISASATFATASADAGFAIQTPTSPASYDLSASERALFVEYLVCSETAAIRMMSEAEAAPCIMLYTQVKLTFVPDVELGEFLKMSLSERQDINIQGYTEYVEWRAANPDLFSELTDLARARIAEQES